MDGRTDTYVATPVAIAKRPGYRNRHYNASLTNYGFIVFRVHGIICQKSLALSQGPTGALPSFKPLTNPYFQTQDLLMWKVQVNFGRGSYDAV